MDAKVIREKREELGLTQSELATLIGVSLRTIQNYEKDGVIPSSKHEILRNVLNTGNINITGDGNIANTGIVEGGIKKGSGGVLLDILKEEGLDREMSNYTPKQVLEVLVSKLRKLEEENEQLKKDKAILQEFVTMLQSKKKN